MNKYKLLKFPKLFNFIYFSGADADLEIGLFTPEELANVSKA